MFKNVKKAFLFITLVLVSVLAFACDETELSKEVCKDYCDPAASEETCKDFCETCTEINKDSCKDYCDPAASKETCKEFIDKEACSEHIEKAVEEAVEEAKKQWKPSADDCKEFMPFVEPTGFLFLSDFVDLETPYEIIVEDFEPYGEDVFQGLYWTSADESIATVTQNGILTGHKPGNVEITAVSVLNPEVSFTDTFTIKDTRYEGDTYNIVNAELNEIISKIPMYAAESFAFDKPWNTNIEMTITNSDSEVVNGFVYPENLEKDTKVAYTIKLKLDETEAQGEVQIWAVKNAKDNVVVRLNSAISAAETLIQDYINGSLVDTDLILPEAIYGTKLVWDSNLPTIITDEGKYIQPLDHTPVKFDLVASCEDNAKSITYNVTAKGYTNEEKVEYILNEGSLALVNGKEVSTSIVLPDYDSKFKAHLTYVSDKPEVLDNTGKLVAPVTEKTEVTYTVTIDYAHSKSYSFKQEATFKVTVVPQNGAAKALDAWLVASKYNSLVNFAYGTEAGNVLDVPTEYMKDEVEYQVKWDVSNAKVAPKYLEDEENAEDQVVNAFELNEEGKPELVVQYLRYTQVSIKVTFVNGEEEASADLVLNIGASTDATAIYTATWESGDQKDSSLNERTGMYDCVSNASHFDKQVGYVARSLGYGYWSGYKVATTFNGKNYEYYNLDYMYWEVRENEDGTLEKAALSLFNNGGDMGGNWGWFMKNTTNHDILVEVGTYAASGQTYADGSAVVSYGSRVSWSMDGYALGFVADATGKVLYGAGINKLQTVLPSGNIVEVGSEEAKYLVGDTAGKGSKVHYLVVPAGGYAMSWKYQFYGQGSVYATEAFCQTGTQLEITKFGVHPLNSYKAQTATTNLKNAEALIEKGGTSNNKSIETYLNNARTIYNDDLAGITREEVFEAERIELAETNYAAMLDAELAILLAKEGTDLPEGEKPFVTQMGEMKTRLDALTIEISSKLQQKAAFDAKYEELAAIDLHVTLDYNGGYAKGLYSADDFDIVIPQLLSDLYDWFVEQGAFQKKIENGALVDDPEGVTPSREEFNAAYLSNNFGSFTQTVLSEYLFTPKVASDGTVNENYQDVIEGTNKFFNSAKYNKWIDIMNFVDEATRRGNMSGQDAWGRKGEVSQPSQYTDEELVKYGGNEVTITNSGTALGAYRFTQYISAASAINVTYRGKIPADIYSAIFDRQTTQERYSVITYHCTDGAVELPKAAHKEGAVFAGWFFEDGTEAEITGATFKDVTVYAKWNPLLEAKVEEAAGEDLEAVYYGESAGGTYTGTTLPGTVSDQVNVVGLGKYAIAVNGKMFIIPKYALIELDGTKEYNTTDDLKVYGDGNSTQDSTGIIISDGAALGKNSYGHGALYQNVSEEAITIPDIKLAYGRTNVSGTAYGYHKYHFSLQEDGSYKAILIGASGSVTLQPGDFFWCPMTAERFCTGLTDCDGTSGVKGVLSDGIELQIVEITDDMLPVEKEWYTVNFVDGENIIKTQYLDEGELIVKPADLNKVGSQFLGWATTKDATEAEEVLTTPTADIIYYAVWEELTMFEATSVNPEADGSNPTEFKTIAEALSKTLAGGTITVQAGTYTDALVIETPVTIKGPNAGVKGYAARAEEAKFEGTIKVVADNVTIDGLAFTGHSAKISEEINGGTKTATVIISSSKNFKLVNSYVISGAGIVFEVNTAENFEMSGNYFNWTKENGATGAWAWRPIRVDGKVTNLTFSDNKVYQTAKDASSSGMYDIIWANQVAGTVNITNNSFVGYSYNWNINLNSAKEATEINYNYNFVNGIDNAEGVNSGNTTILVKNMGAATNANFIANTVNTAGTTFSYDIVDGETYTGKITITDNKFLGSEFKPRIYDSISSENLVFENNYIKAGQITELEANKYEFSLTGNFTSEDEFDAANYEATKTFTVTSVATGYVNGTGVYLSAKYQFNAYYVAEVSLKYDVATNTYIVLANEQNCTAEVGSYDLLLAVHSACTDAEAKALIPTLKAGDRISFDADFATITGYSKTTAVTINATVYPVKVSE